MNSEKDCEFKRYLSIFVYNKLIRPSPFGVVSQKMPVVRCQQQGACTFLVGD